MDERSRVDTQQHYWHALDINDVLEALHTSHHGLRDQDAIERLDRHGANRLPEPPRQSAVARFLRQVHNVLIYVMVGAAIVTLSLGHLTDTAVILAVVLVNAIIGYIQEGRAEKAMDAIRHMLAPRAAVMRNGRRTNIAGEDLVPGDIVLLEAGDRVPADLRLISVHGMTVQEAILTGESVPVEKHGRGVAADAVLGDRSCLAFSGTLVATGQGRGVVVATGEDTEIGRISGMLTEVEQLTSPLVRQMDAFARWLSILILLVAAVLLVFGYFLEHISFSEMFMVVVAMSASAIPEGLPAVLTITLAIGVQAMARRNAIVRRLPAIETIGAVSVICTDKTGTLTRNEMMVTSAVMADRQFEIGGNGYEPRGPITADGAAIGVETRDGLADLALACALCNDAHIVEQNGDWSVEGDPMEGALLAFSGKLGHFGGEAVKGWQRIDTIPFDSRSRYMAVLCRSVEGKMVAFVKGAPERILEMASQQRASNGAVATLDTAFWKGQADGIAARGQRVLAFAMVDTDGDRKTVTTTDIDGNITFLGMVGMIDPPRKEAIEAVARCRGAGITVKMITGDHAGTASAIARQIGLDNPGEALTGAELEAMNDVEFQNAVRRCNVFARTSPEHKLRLVMALQAQGMIVAMTGDGVNDAPALRRADAGIAMGMKGSEAAKEAADLVLADDNFASIVSAVQEGRTVYDNIKKVITWTLPTNAGEAATIIVALLFGLILPMTPVQILWINLVPEVTLGFALAFEPTEDSTMRRLPRPRDEAILSSELLWHIVMVSGLFLAGVFGIFVYAIDKGHSLELARTMAVNTIVVMEIFHLFFVRNIYGTSLTIKAALGNKVVWLTVIIVTVAQFAFTYFPPLQLVFGTEPVPLVDGILIIAIGAAMFAVIETEKQLRLTVKNHFGASA